MYGLPQARYIANDQLIPILKAAGYHQAKNTPGLFKHLWQPITFSLVVDDFGIKYVSKEHADHLIHTLEKSTPSHKIGLEQLTLDSHSSGIMKTTQLTSPCQGTLKKPSNAFNTLHPCDCSM